MRQEYDFNQWAKPLESTPRAKQKPNIPQDMRSRRSTTPNKPTTPTKMHHRISSSPLNLPLEKAISKVTKNRQRSTERASQSRYLGRSSKRQESSIISMAKKIYYDEEPEKQQIKAHTQTYNFIRKNFGANTKQIPIESFIHKIMDEYESLWGTQNVGKIFDDFTYKITDIFGCQVVYIPDLIRITRQDGMIGLILRIFKEIKSEQNIRNSNFASFSQSPQIMSLNRSFEDRLTENDNINGIKNVVQQFMETMYQCMQSQIYNKFNIEMRRMVVKYRQAEKLLKKVNEKITLYADIFDIEKKMKEKQKNYEKIIEQLKKEKEQIYNELTKERESCSNEKRQREKLVDESNKLKQNLEKYQNAVLNRALENTYAEPPLNRYLSSQSRVLDKTNNENMMMNSKISQNEPFKITIDTQFVHKESGPPQTKTFTTFHNPPTISPRRESQDGTQSQIPSTFSASTIGGISPHKYSPYHSRVGRQF